MLCPQRRSTVHADTVSVPACHRTVGLVLRARSFNFLAETNNVRSDATNIHEYVSIPSLRLVMVNLRRPQFKKSS